MLGAPKEIAHAILLVDGAYVLQLRDDIPGIPARGIWSLFGGALEEGETPEAGLREISEERGLQLPEVRLFRQVDRHSEFWQPGGAGPTPERRAPREPRLVSAGMNTCDNM